jgi:hypothetical protein
MNTIHRSRIEKEFAMPLSKWQKTRDPNQVEVESITKPYAGEA